MKSSYGILQLKATDNWTYLLGMSTFLETYGLLVLFKMVCVLGISVFKVEVCMF